jgi:RimJ/RimL family protein N-acetyltransferase
VIPCEIHLAKGILLVAQAGVEDAKILLKHTRQVAGESDFLKAGPGERTLTARLQAAFLNRLQTQHLGFILKGERGGRLVAVLTVVRPQQPRLHHRAELGLTVRADHWGQGIGHGMATLGIRLAQAQGVRKLNLSVRADHQRALRLYRSLGFKREGISARALRVGRRFYSEIQMGLCLDSPSRNRKRSAPRA